MSSNRIYTHSSINNGIYNKDIESGTTFVISGGGDVKINGNIAGGVIIHKIGSGDLKINGTVAHNARFVFSGNGDVIFAKAPPASVINAITESNRGSIKILDDDYDHSSTFTLNNFTSSISPCNNFTSTIYPNNDLNNNSYNNINFQVDGMYHHSNNVNNTASEEKSFIYESTIQNNNFNWDTSISNTYFDTPTDYNQIHIGIISPSEEIVDGNECSSFIEESKNSPSTDFIDFFNTNESKNSDISNFGNEFISNIIDQEVLIPKKRKVSMPNNIGDSSFNIMWMLYDEWTNNATNQSMSGLQEIHEDSQATLIQQCSKPVKQYFANVQLAEKMSDKINALKLTTEEEKLFEEFKDVKTKQYMQIPLCLNERYFDISTLANLKNQDPMTRDEYHPLEIQACRKLMAKLDDVIAKLNIDRSAQLLQSIPGGPRL